MSGDVNATGPASDFARAIPSSFPTSIREAVEVYQKLGFAIHPCHGPQEGRVGERGKKPRFSGWTQWTASSLTEALKNDLFGGEKPSNIGHVIRPPFVVVDLDSKPDSGKSVEAWLSTQTRLASVPRERTAGGAHLIFICPDLPQFMGRRGQPYRKNLVSQINETTSAELIFCGNVIHAPSVHASGHHYAWEVTGEIPSVSWTELQDIFGFEEPGNDEEEGRGRGRPKKEKPWWSRFKGDLGTLDAVALVQELGRYGSLLSADEQKHSLRCPWAEEHGDKGAGWTPRSSDTVIFEGQDKKWPVFHCLHQHCAERSLPALLAWAEKAKPGIVDRHCAAARIWRTGQRSGDGVRPRVLLPGVGRSDSDFAAELGLVVARKLAWFNFADNPVVVREAQDSEQLGHGLVLHPLRPVEVITEAEHHAEIGAIHEDEAGDRVFRVRSMSEANARTILSSQQLRRQLPPIRRVLDIPLPVLHEGSLIYPTAGYDKRFKTFLAPEAPVLQLVSFQEARDLILNEVLSKEEKGGFCWKDEQALCHAVARLITPFCRGLMGWHRPPLWIIEANRERCGKDYFAQVACLLYVGRKIIFPPITKDAEEELRKRITTALMANARFIHFSNLKGHIRFAALEAATDNTGVWQDRVLGGNTEACLPNEADFSFSANAGTTWEPDIEGRARRIALHYGREEINARRFRHPDLHDYIMAHRTEILSAIAALVTEWDRQGRPQGPTAFSSFPEWARVVGGVMHACELGNPCLPHKDTNAATGDQHTENMKRLFVLAAEAFGDTCVKKKALIEFIKERQDAGVFDWVDLETRSGQTRLGMLITKYANRELAGVRLEIPPSGKNNVEYRFLRVDDAPSQGTSGTSGTFDPATHETEIITYEVGSKGGGINERLYNGKAEAPEVPEVPARVLPIREQAALGDIAHEMAEADAPIALDIETYRANGGGGALNPYLPGSEIRLLTICLPGREPWVIDLKAVGYDLGPLGEVLQTGEVVGHNLKFDLLWLRAKCRLNIRKVFCTLTASRLLTAGMNEPNDLGAVIERHLGFKLPKALGRSDWSSEVLSDEQLAYAANDVRHLHLLRGKLEAACREAGLERVLELEMRLLPAVVDVEAAGFPVDRAKLQQVRDAAEARVREAEAKVQAVFGDRGLNVASHGQLKAGFERLGIKLPNTCAETLSDINHDAARLVLEYRGHEKLSQQAVSLLRAVCPDGRIHARFEPTGADTGRFSSRQPNLQNVGRGDLRNAFVAGPGRVLVVADYSQIELRGAAAIANDPAMLDAYHKGEDIHRKTAALVLGKTEDAVTKDDRQLAKAINFGLFYGQQVGGLVRSAKSSYDITITEVVNDNYS